MRVRLRMHAAKTTASPHALAEGITHPRASDRPRRTVWLATRRRVEAQAQARHRLRPPRTDGRKRLRHVPARGWPSGDGRHAAAPVSGNTAWPQGARRLERGHDASDSGVRAMTRPGDRLRAWASRLFDADTMKRLID